MTIQGHYKKDDNFITVFCDGVMYTIARNTGDWGALKVGKRAATGQLFAKEEYDRMVAECDQFGAFELE